MADVVAAQLGLDGLTRPSCQHYRKLDLCRVRRGLPRGKTRALGKDPLCRAPNPALGKGRFAECLTLGKLRHSAKKFFAECRALGKHGHSAKSARGQTASMAVTFAEYLPLGTRQRAATWPAQGHQAHVGMYWFVNIVRAMCSKLFQILTTAYAYDIMTSRQVSRFSEFVCIF